MTKKKPVKLAKSKSKGAKRSSKQSDVFIIGMHLGDQRIRFFEKPHQLSTLLASKKIADAKLKRHNRQFVVFKMVYKTLTPTQLSLFP